MYIKTRTPAGNFDQSSMGNDVLRRHCPMSRSGQPFIIRNNPSSIPQQHPSDCVAIPDCCTRPPDAKPDPPTFITSPDRPLPSSQSDRLRIGATRSLPSTDGHQVAILSKRPRRQSTVSAIQIKQKIPQIPPMGTFQLRIRASCFSRCGLIC